ncbi:BufA1 family periplasmic bufferin-type metallophore [Pseudogulbenkiania subflava]|uniref:Uncharacterized membrane protein n=1 Tax=Pseudogulbenkiania subflava DSM 22618 TaxID=1123014 RepID=A0A1Y6B8X5_9NEIS|nr:DUF2282 domain-containing protein [Pseudogulbenkiania subflava]SME99069.1 Uncharacterized membrane protein [Pseudogulbenkiania subflava DSM 22618]
MNTSRTLIVSALGAFVALGSLAPAMAAEKEKCFGVAKAGKNDCASVVGTHACAGQSKVDNDPTDWKFVAKGSCTQMGGTLQAPKK